MFSRFLPKSLFARNVITLMTGTSLAQAIPIAVSPILTRLYTPADFGVFALYLSIAAIASILVTGRYELAITLPKKDSDAANIVALSIGLSCLISGILLLIVFVFNSQITHVLGSPAVSNWLYFVPVSTALMGVYQSLNYWSNRKGDYKRMAMSRIAQGSGSSLAQLVGGYSAIGPSGLVGGQIIGQFLSIWLLGRMIWRDDQKDLGTINKTRILAQARRYLAFPKYLVVAHGFNTGSAQMPVIFISSLFGSSLAGFYMLTQRVIEAPMSLVAGAIGDVFRQEASYSYARMGSCEVVYVKTFKRLFFISVVPFLVFFFVAPDLFIFIFGKDWMASGEYAQILTPMFFMRFVVSPLSYMFIIAQKQRLDLTWQIALFTLVLLSFSLGGLYINIKGVLAIFCSCYCVMYMVNGIISYKLAKGFK